MNIKERYELIDGFFNKGWACNLDEVYNAVIGTIKELEELNDKKQDRITELEEINKQHQEINSELRQKLDCKEILKQSMPENTEFVILTKANYDRQQKDIELELIDYKERCEKAIEYIQDTNNYLEIRGDFDGYVTALIDKEHIDNLLNILQDKEEV